jgi:hypothetical protein
MRRVHWFATTACLMWLDGCPKRHQALCAPQRSRIPDDLTIVRLVVLSPNRSPITVFGTVRRRIVVAL